MQSVFPGPAQSSRHRFDGLRLSHLSRFSSTTLDNIPPHTDIIRKGGRATHYGHKINLSTGRSAQVLDVVVEEGNPADSERCLPMLRRHVENYGEPP